MNHTSSAGQLKMAERTKAEQTKGTRNHAKWTTLTSKGWLGDHGSNLIGVDAEDMCGRLPTLTFSGGFVGCLGAATGKAGETEGCL